MARGYTLEKEFKVYDDDSGEFVSVTTDADSLDLVELRQGNQAGMIIARITLTVEAARLFHSAFGAYLDGLDVMV